MAARSTDPSVIDDFLAAIAAVEKAYLHSAFNYIAFKSRNRFVICRGRVYLNTADPQLRQMSFQSSNVRAGRFTLDELGVNLREFIAQLRAGIIDTPGGPLYFEAAEGVGFSFSFVPFHPDGLQAQRRFNVLTLEAGPVAEMLQPDLDWEIKAAALPYDGLQEITNELALAGLEGPNARIELVAFNAAVIDAQRSKLSGTKAEVYLKLSNALIPDAPALPTARMRRTSRPNAELCQPMR